jgi:hypothetical protein
LYAIVIEFGFKSLVFFSYLNKYICAFVDVIRCFLVWLQLLCRLHLGMLRKLRVLSLVMCLFAGCLSPLLRILLL